jgi:hypothetical protein
MKKRGQVTIFIIIGIVFLIILATLFLSSNPLPEYQDATTVKMAPIQEYIQRCLATSMKQGVEKIAKNGGYHESTQILKESSFGVPFWFMDNMSITPSRRFIEEQISLEIQQGLQTCLDNFQVFIDQGYTVESTREGLLVEVEILENHINAKASLNKKISKADTSIQLDSFSEKMEMPLGKLYDVSTNILETFLIKENALCISCFSLIGNQKNVVIEYERYGEEYIFSIHEPQEKFILRFASGFGDQTGILIPLEFYFDFNLFDEISKEQEEHVNRVLEATR